MARRGRGCVACREYERPIYSLPENAQADAPLPLPHPSHETCPLRTPLPSVVPSAVCGAKRLRDARHVPMARPDFAFDGTVARHGSGHQWDGVGSQCDKFSTESARNVTYLMLSTFSDLSRRAR